MNYAYAKNVIDRAKLSIKGCKDEDYTQLLQPKLDEVERKLKGKRKNQDLNREEQALVEDLEMSI
ncbi:TPA: hypothetical protein DEP21_02340 [Patescibacteria group bacterium]|nr:hypothetical protein [Candidatus Gracilibacteria bacterium]